LAYTLQNYLDEIKDIALGDRSDLTDATITRWVNTAQERIARVHNWRELRQTTDITLGFTGVAATDKVLDFNALLGTNFRAVHNFVIEDGAESLKLERLGPDQFDEIIPLPEYFATGRPTIYTVWTKTETLLHKVPDEAYTARIRWHKWPTALSSGSDVTDFDRKDDLILHLTLSFAFALYRAEESAMKHFGIYQSILKESIGEDANNPDLQVVRPNFLVKGGRVMGSEYWNDPFYKG